MNPEIVSIPRVVETVYQAGRWLNIVLTGGGAGLVPWLLQRPGGSKVINEMIIPYSERALRSYLGHTPEQFCAPETAQALAVVAFRRARDQLGGEPPCAGVACTASLVTNRPKRGDHRIHVAYQTEGTTGALSLVLIKGLRHRTAEDQLAARLCLSAIAEACELSVRPNLPLKPGEEVLHQRFVAPQHWQAVFLGLKPFDFAWADGAQIPPRPWAILSGSFNPFHEGHRAMIELASRLLNLPVILEISLINADKPPLDYCSLAKRLNTIPPGIPVILTTAPTFVQKARLFPQSIFVVGVDTLIRIIDRRFYSGEESLFTQALQEFISADCRFLVFGRQIGNRFVTADQLALPESLRDRCQTVPESLFRVDISSTEIRQLKGLADPTLADNPP